MWGLVSLETSKWAIVAPTIGAPNPVVCFIFFKIVNKLSVYPSQNLTSIRCDNLSLEFIMESDYSWILENVLEFVMPILGMLYF